METAQWQRVPVAVKRLKKEKTSSVPVINLKLSSFLAMDNPATASIVYCEKLFRTDNFGPDLDQPASVMGADICNLTVHYSEMPQTTLFLHERNRQDDPGTRGQGGVDPLHTTDNILKVSFKLFLSAQCIRDVVLLIY